MYKKEIKDQIKDLKKAAEENLNELKTLDVLNDPVPKQERLDYSQNFIKNNVNLYTAEKAFNINLPNGPFKCKYTQNGSNLLVTNQSGYLSSFNSQKFSLNFETTLNDKIFDSSWLHNELYFGCAQDDCVFIYDNTGSELHAVRDMKNTRKLEFLPYHFLLAGATNNGHMNYLDTSIGEIVSSLFIGDKNPTVLTSNPSNAIIHLGSSTGIVSLWAPSQKSFLMKVKCHNSSITGIEIDRSGTQMVTTGTDNKINVFDIRNTYKPMKSIKVKQNIHFTALSDRNLLAIGYSDKLAILKDFEYPYMQHKTPGAISSLEFCKHEDILCIGHKNGISSIVVPGSGDPIYDTNEDSPFLTKKERKKIEVKKLLDKIPYDLISLKPILGTLEKPVKKEEQTNNKNNQHERNALSRFYNHI